jgi:calcium/proton exchanger cax
LVGNAAGSSRLSYSPLAICLQQISELIIDPLLEEHVTAVVVSVKDKIDLSITIAVGSSIQIALFVVPVLVLLAWCIGRESNLYRPLLFLSSTY